MKLEEFIDWIENHLEERSMSDNSDEIHSSLVLINKVDDYASKLIDTLVKATKEDYHTVSAYITEKFQLHRISDMSDNELSSLLNKLNKYGEAILNYIKREEKNED